MNKISQILSRIILLTIIYKSFVNSKLNYADITYEEPLNESFKKKI